MNEPKFTPGPWEFDVELRWVKQPGEQEVHGAWNVYPVDDCDHIIATVNHVYPDRNTCRCNARMLAAAPDLYAALAEIVDTLDANDFAHWVATARAALAKAVPHD